MYYFPTSTKIVKTKWTLDDFNEVTNGGYAAAYLTAIFGNESDEANKLAALRGVWELCLQQSQEAPIFFG
jgi:hypothetical protein